MELKIVTDSRCGSFNEQVGISEERANQLSKRLDELVASYGSSAVRVCDIFNDIANFCDNLEEYTYCVINHVNWHSQRGFLFVLSKPK